MCLLFLVCTVGLAHADPDVLLSKGDISVGLDDAVKYSLRQTNPERYVESISRPRATVQVLENIYVLERGAVAAEQAGLIDGADERYLARDAYRRAALSRYLDNVVEQRMATIDWDGLALEEYLRRKQEFREPEEVRVEHILISWAERPFDDFVLRVRMLQDELDLGADFGALISQYSDDPSVDRNAGDLGFFRRERMQPAFSAAAFDLIEPGEMVGPIMTRFGAHFIRLIERREERDGTFEEAKRSLVKELKKAMPSRLREEFLSEFKQEVEPELTIIDEDALLARFLQAYEMQKDNGPQ